MVFSNTLPVVFAQIFLFLSFRLMIEAIFRVLDEGDIWVLVEIRFPVETRDARVLALVWLGHGAPNDPAHEF